MNKVENILPWITVLEFKFQELPTISSRHSFWFKLIQYSAYDEGNQIMEQLTCTPYSLAFIRESCMSLYVWRVRWLPPIAHFPLNPANCLSTRSFRRSPFKAVSVYSKSASVWNSAQGWHSGAGKNLIVAWDKDRGVLLDVRGMIVMSGLLLWDEGWSWCKHLGDVAHKSCWLNQRLLKH